MSLLRKTLCGSSSPAAVLTTGGNTRSVASHAIRSREGLGRGWQGLVINYCTWSVSLPVGNQLALHKALCHCWASLQGEPLVMANLGDPSANPIPWGNHDKFNQRGKRDCQPFNQRHPQQAVGFSEYSKYPTSCWFIFIASLADEPNSFTLGGSRHPFFTISV